MNLMLQLNLECLLHGVLLQWALSSISEAFYFVIKMNIWGHFNCCFALHSIESSSIPCICQPAAHTASWMSAHPGRGAASASGSSRALLTVGNWKVKCSQWSKTHWFTWFFLKWFYWDITHIHEIHLFSTYGGCWYHQEVTQTTFVTASNSSLLTILPQLRQELIFLSL